MDDKKPIATHYGYPCRYTPTIMDGPVIRWGRGYPGFEVSASRNGVMTHGSSPTLTGGDIARLTKLLTFAERVHRDLYAIDANRLPFYGSDLFHTLLVNDKCE